MEYLLSIVLGGLASWMQKGSLEGFPKWAKFALAVFACASVSLALNIYNAYSGGTFDKNELLALFGTSFTASQALYNVYFANKK